jgi:phage FluMu protein Com
MFDDETIDLACPKCGFKNSLLIRDFEQTAETHITCQGCRVGIKVEASEFQQRLSQISNELETIGLEVRRAQKKNQYRPRKGDFQI